MQFKGISARGIVLFLVFVLFVPFLPLIITGRVDWWEAWVYAAILILGFIASRLLAVRHSPDLLAERSRFFEHQDTKSWDRILSPLVGMGSAFLPLFAGLDALNGRMDDFSNPVKIAALGILLAGYIFSTWAFVENAFFSGTVRIQTERGHRVISSGPYAFVRHPGYAGSLLTTLAVPIFLDSWWTFIPAVVLIAALMLRTALEDKTLQKELEGYREYTGKVRYRLIPGIW